MKIEIHLAVKVNFNVSVLSFDFCSVYYVLTLLLSEKDHFDILLAHLLTIIWDAFVSDKIALIPTQYIQNG